jgi:hypothetical protein
MDREELVKRSEDLRGKLLRIADQLEYFLNVPKYDETYKLAWYPKLTSENFDEVERVVETLTNTFDTVLRIDV